MAAGAFAGPGPVISPMLELFQKLEQHNSAIAGTVHGPVSWSAVWLSPQASQSMPGKPTSIPVLFELVNMTEEEIDVQEACDAGLVDREDLVDPLSTPSDCLLLVAMHDMLLLCSVASSPVCRVEGLSKLDLDRPCCELS